MFGSSEGLFGASGPGETTLTFASDMCVVELVDERNQPVPPGTPSAKALVTNLYNRVQPLIRYELTDSFVRQPDVVDHGHLRATVAGRSREALRYGTVDVHPAVITTAVVQDPAIVDYQAHQTPDGIDLTVLAHGPLDTGRLRDRLHAPPASAGLPDPHVAVSVAATLGRHEQSGKLRRLVLAPG